MSDAELPTTSVSTGHAVGTRQADDSLWGSCLRILEGIDSISWGESLIAFEAVASIRERHGLSAAFLDRKKFFVGSCIDFF